MKTDLALLLILAMPLAARLPAQEATPADPRALLERGAFVEEYERDPARAQALYDQAEEAARAVGDEETVRAAAAARARSRARQAGAPAVAAFSQEEGIVERIGELLDGLSRIPLGVGSGSGEWVTYNAITTDLKVYGDAVVPWLERLLAPAVIEIGAWRVSLDTRMAARQLTSLEGDVALAALARALQAKDPLIRHAVAEELDADEHRTLLEQAAHDPIAQVRTVAVRRLADLCAPEHLPLFEPEALQGENRAVRWMVKVAPERLLECLLEGKGNADFRARSVRDLVGASLPATRASVESLLRLARELEDAEDRVKVLEALNYYLRRTVWRDAAPSLRAAIQGGLLAFPDRYPPEEAALLLSEVGDYAAFAHLSRELASWPEGRSKRETQWLESAIGGLRKRLVPADFDPLALLLRELPPDPTRPADELSTWHAETWSDLVAFAKTGAIDAAAIERGIPEEPGPLRRWYYWVVQSWLHRPGVDPSARAGLTALLPILREMMQSDEPFCDAVKGDAMLALAQAGDHASLPRILELTAHGNDLVHDPAATAVERFYRADPQRTFEATVAAITRGAARARALLLLEGRELEAFRAAWAGLRDEEARRAALATLVTTIDSPGSDALVAELYPQMTDAKTRARAIHRFGISLFEPAIPRLGQALEDPDQDVRANAREAFQRFKSHREALEEFAAWTLGDRQARQQIDELVELLASDDPGVVLGTVKALGVIRARAALPRLVRLLERKDEALSAAVYEAIERIGG